MKNYLASITSIISITLFLCFKLNAQDGGSTASYLQLGAGARAIGLGSAFTGVSDDGSALFWNPAGLSLIKQNIVSGMYSFLQYDRNHDYLSIAHPFNSRYGTLALNILHYGVANIEGRDLFGEKTENFSDNEIAIDLGYGVFISHDKISIGFSFRYLYQSLYNNNAHGIAFNMGTLVKILPFFKFGISANNIGGYLKWNTDSGEKENIPLSLRGGIAICPENIPLLVSADVEKRQNIDKIFAYAGIEYWLLKPICLRIGYNQKGFLFGGSIKYDFLQIDYVYSTESELDAVNRIGINLSF